ncbi:DUF1990 domain-containing protein [Corynebacterium sp.]|uniref:DUF1990 family protein n=1 Tax=Corynebacterium sp. TaxID=1720 RepID=UPI0028B11E6E|nr:DUF1990 domain-containing protein [Corynebacterium sp.]
MPLRRPSSPPKPPDRPQTERDLTYAQDMAGLSASIHDIDDHPVIAERLRSGGFHHLSHSRVIGHGAADRDRALTNLFSGRAHRVAGAPLYRSGTPLSADTPLAPGDVVTVTPGRGLLTPLDSPCLVLTAGPSSMIYGTLPGHVECGEEFFGVSLNEDGTVTATVSAFSRPGRLIARVGGALGRRIQARMASAYISGMEAA